MHVNDSPPADTAALPLLHPGSRQLYRYWETLRGDRAAPQRDEINLRDLSDVLPQLAIIERNAFSAFHWRLAGSAIERMFGFILTGTNALLLGDRFERETIANLYHCVLDGLQPCLIRFRLHTQSGGVIGIEQLGLPIVSPQHNTITIFCGLFPFNDRELEGAGVATGLELISTRMIWTEHLPGDRLVASLTTSKAEPFKLRVIEGGKSRT